MRRVRVWLLSPFSLPLGVDDWLLLGSEAITVQGTSLQDELAVVGRGRKHGAREVTSRAVSTGSHVYNIRSYI